MREFVKTPAGEIELLVAEPRERETEKTPIFFVHGGNGHAAVWLEWMTHLSETYGARTYAYSLRNHGASFAVPYFNMVWGTSLDDLAEDLVAAIKEAQRREGQELVFVAHSSGGGLSQYVLSKGFVKARGLALVGAVPHFGNVSCSTYGLGGRKLTVAVRSIHKLVQQDRSVVHNTQHVPLLPSQQRPEHRHVSIQRLLRS